MAHVQGKRLCCRTHLFTCWYRPAQSAHVCHHSEIQPIQWQMDRHYHLFPAHRYQGASHPAACTPKLVHLADATWIITSVKIQCRQWLMSQTRWCLVHWRLYTKISLRHRAVLWEWYPASKKMPISRPVGRFNQWDLSESNPIHPSADLPPWCLMNRFIQSCMKCVRRAIKPFRPLPETGRYVSKSFTASTINFEVSKIKISF